MVKTNELRNQRRVTAAKAAATFKAFTLTAFFLLGFCIGDAKAETIHASIRGEMNKATVSNAIDALQKAVPGDVIHLHINSGGGEYWTGLAILAYTKTTLASKVIMEVHGFAGSAAALILLGADEVQAEESDYVMFHTPYLFEEGKINRPIIYTLEITQWTARDYCLDKILTPKGWKAFYEGVDVYLRGDTFVRLNTKHNCGVQHVTNP